MPAARHEWLHRHHIANQGGEFPPLIRSPRRRVAAPMCRGSSSYARLSQCCKGRSSTSIVLARAQVGSVKHRPLVPDAQETAWLPNACFSAVNVSSPRAMAGVMFSNLTLSLLALRKTRNAVQWTSIGGRATSGASRLGFWAIAARKTHLGARSEPFVRDRSIAPILACPRHVRLGRNPGNAATAKMGRISIFI
jgi:hypothetical protein